jgi:hypothetical protein
MARRESAVSKLRKEKKWLVREVGRDIELIRMLSGKPIVISLRRQTGKKKFQLEFPSYIFHSTISHFSPAVDEVRFCRNKALLKSLVKTLKRSAVWRMVDNQQFMVLNADNPRSDKRSVKKQLKELYDYDPQKKRRKKKS